MILSLVLALFGFPSSCDVTAARLLKQKLRIEKRWTTRTPTARELREYARIRDRWNAAENQCLGVR